jgi:AraC family transcriptional regulator
MPPVPAVYRNYHGQLIRRRVVKGLPLAEAVYASGTKLSRHSHRHSSFCLVLRGGYTESYGPTHLHCQPLCVKFQPADEEHTDVYGNVDVRCFIVELETEWLARTGASEFVASQPHVHRERSLAWSMTRLRSEFLVEDDESSLVIEGLVLELIARASRTTTSGTERRPPRWLGQTRELLHEQFAERLTLSRIADVAGVHPVYLASAFRRHYRQSIGEYLRERRIEVACRRIAESDEPLVEIALATGFASQSHFTQEFRRITGTTPGRYRDGCRASSAPDNTF